MTVYLFLRWSGMWLCALVYVGSAATAFGGGDVVDLVPDVLLPAGQYLDVLAWF